MFESCMGKSGKRPKMLLNTKLNNNKCQLAKKRTSSLKCLFLKVHTRVKMKQLFLWD